MDKQKIFFREQLLHWHSHHNDRVLPWKQEKDPYRIWLSEIILQQTRAEQGLPYYLKFTTQYPTVQELAVAPEEEVFRLWQGLGYYNRCKNMLATARIICSEHAGAFPADYNAILTLKGIGPYTAAAIASFAFGLPHAVVDGNVYRVLARYFGIETATDTTEGKQLFAALADELLDKDHSAAYNQAIMDFGATVCTPKNPICLHCPLQQRCMAYRQGLVQLLPIKSKKLQVRNRYFNYLLFSLKGKVWIRKRSGRDIWENLHEPYLVETEGPVSLDALKQDVKNMLGPGTKIELAANHKQRLTHQLIESKLYRVELEEVPGDLPEDGFWVKEDETPRYAFPRTLSDFFSHE